MFNENDALKEAVYYSTLSNCGSKRGVVIFHRKYGVMCGGFNHLPWPLKCDGTPACRSVCAKTALHAEQDALLNWIQNVEAFPTVNIFDCEMLHVKSVDGKAVHSLQPSCWQCSKLILGSGLKAMWLYQAEGLVSYTAKDFHELTLKNNKL